MTDNNVIEHGQYMTPSWAAEAIVKHIGLENLKPGAVVIEPSCGIGRFLDALPSHLSTIGVDIDHKMVSEARARGHRVLLGDFRSVKIPFEKVKAIIGNPPFQMEIFDGILDRSRDLLEEGGEASFILPCYAFQTANRVVRWNKDWSLSQEMLPRTLFHGLSKPIMLARFVKDPQPKLKGLIFYYESAEIEAMPAVYKRALVEGRSGWKDVIKEALSQLGGQANLAQIYKVIEPQKPTATAYWKEKVRQQLQRHFEKIGPSEYALN